MKDEDEATVDNRRLDSYARERARAQAIRIQESMSLRRDQSNPNNCSNSYEVFER